MAPVWTSVFLAASALVSLSAAEGTVAITGCKNGTTNIFNRHSLYLYCYDLTNADGVFHWTLRTENGREVPLGTCHEVNNCTSLMTNTRLERSSSFRSQLNLYSINKNMSGDITCTVTTVGTNVVGTGTCHMNVGRIQIYSHTVAVLDGNKLYVSVFLSLIGHSRITVTVTAESGEIIVQGVCTQGQSLCTPLTDNFRIYNGNYYLGISSQTELERRFAGRVSISVSFGGKPETDYFMINLYNPPSVDNCSVDVHSHNWTALLSCDVRHAFSSAGIYQFRLLEFAPDFFSRNDVNTFRDANSSSGLKRHEDQSFFPSMRSYFNTTANKTYYRGRLEYSWRLSPLNKDFKYGTVLLCTSTYAHKCVFPTPLFIRLPNVAMPGEVSHNCSQLRHIPENSAVTCACSTGSVGVPAGRLLWLLDNVAWTTGQYGVTQLTLSIQSVTRNQTAAKQATCRLDWIDPQEVHLPLNTAYGPDKVSVEVYMNTDGNRLTAECQVSGLEPRTPDMVQWEGPCQGQQGFTCTLDPSQTDVRGKTVTCRVTNSANNGHSASADKVIERDFNKDPSESDSDKMKWSTIGGGVMLAVVVVVTLLVMMVICICRRGHLCFASQPGGKQETSITMDQHLYETLESTAPNTAGSRGQPQTPERGSSVYENSGFSGVAENHM